ncbi:MAG: HmuY family protein [Bacteroidota bacterium]|nr:HmuY family protein [Bacteroidota bacterium]
MKLVNRHSIYIIFALALFSTQSCMKKDPKWKLENNADGLVEEFNMGDSFQNVVFFDCETGNFISKSIHDWDIAFACDPNKFGIQLNTGSNLAVYNTNDTAFHNKYSKPPLNKLQFDHPQGSLDSTGFRQCWDKFSLILNKSIFIIRYVKDTSGPQDRFIIFQALEKTANYFKFRWRYLESSSTNYTVEKVFFDKNYNFVHYKFANKKVLFFEPPKEDWDFKITKYTDFLINLGQPYPYIVRGVISNHYNVLCAVDSNYKYEDISLQVAKTFQYSDFKDAIGYDWKYYDFALSRYTVRKNRNYIIRNRSNDYFKLKFVDYYDKQGKPGVPKFVFKKLR